MISDFQLAHFLPYRMNRLAERVSESLATVYAQRFQVSVAQWRVLATLQAAPGSSATAVAASCNLDKVKVSRAVADLEARRLLRRQRCASDGRASELRLTPAGQRLFAQISPLALDWERGFLDHLAPAEQAALLRIIDKLEVHMHAGGPGQVESRSGQVGSHPGPVDSHPGPVNSRHDVVESRYP